ncbi:hypothetical protein GPU13_09745 [Streptococcus thermophilus]|nr:hypothetical protein [Streptococcus thermophilus]MCE2083003.1 hypothetical protein [Streptococcus thermophilus]MCE2129274.1 hypothetical protein [Streptococcus thermophilus]
MPIFKFFYRVTITIYDKIFTIIELLKKSIDHIRQEKEVSTADIIKNTGIEVIWIEKEYGEFYGKNKRFMEKHKMV